MQGFTGFPAWKRGMTGGVIDAFPRLCLLHGVRLQDELLHAPGFDFADDDLESWRVQKLILKPDAMKKAEAR